MNGKITGLESSAELEALLDALTDGQAMLLDRHGMKTFIGRFTAGQLPAIELEAIAELLEVNERVEFSGDGAVLAEVIFQLANPGINGAITMARATRLWSSLD